VLARVGRIMAAGHRPAPLESPPAAVAAATGPSITPALPAPVRPPGAKARGSVPAMPPPLDPRLVHLMCPRKTCGRVMSVGPELRGTSVTCTHCGGALRVPTSAKPAGVR